METDEKNFAAGDSNRITREYFDSLLIETRYIDSVIPNTTLELYGEKFSTPVMTAALSHLDKFYKECENGMVETAKGAFAAGAVMWAGMGDDAELEAITATGARTIKIIKPYADEELIYSQVRYAEKCGALAVGMDIDHSFARTGQYDNVQGYAMNAKTLDDLKKYVRATRLPFIVKGVLSAKDAEKCLEAGVKGIVVSHHHGISDYAIPPLMVLPKIVEVMGGRMPVFVDCGINRGFDAFKALALGATAVSVGRAVISDLVREGAEGVKKRIEAMNSELAGAMARTGSPDIRHIDPEVLWKK
jgi:isopentenyl diphosphate isomerase/L-lactate dehydrogenase-like FMN-dependent dehydrogenase